MEKTFSLKNSPLKIHRVLDPIKISPSVVSTTIKKEAPTGNAPMAAIPPKAVTNCFPQVGFACLNRENGPGGTPSHEALSVSPQGALEIVVGQPPSLDRNHFSTPRVVPESHKRDERCRPSSQKGQSIQLFTDASNKGCRTHLEQASTKGLWSDRKKKATHKCSRAEGGFSGPS